jgi:hypothetical protein
MNKNTPPKHKTQNYKLVTYTTRHFNAFGQGGLTTVSHTSRWEPVPLRSNRKDL